MTFRAGVDAMGAGAAQLVFSTRPATGAIVLLAVVLVAPVSAVTAVVGLAAATAVAIWSRWNRLLLRDGLFGYNGVLLGLVWPAIFGPTSPGFWLLVPAAIGTTALFGALLPAFSRRNVPLLGLPFLAVAWLASAVGTLLGWRAAIAPPPVIGGPLAGWSDPVILRAIVSAAAPALVVFLLVALAVFLDARRRLGAMLLGAGAGLGAAVLLGGAEGLLWTGAFAYNAVPAAVGLDAAVEGGRRRRIALAAGGAALAAVAWAFVTPPLLAIALFPLTAPMYGVLLACHALTRRATAASAKHADPEALEALTGLLRRSSRIVVLTGAGTSTESDIPDYRSQIGFWFDANGEDLVYERFLQSEDSRRLYWRLQARFARVMAHARPNAAHLAIAQLEREGRLLGVITQNVDGLHQRAGSSRVVELHGSAHWVVCLACRRRTPYESLPSRTGYAVPVCEVCGGMLKTETVSYGEPLARDRFTQAAQWSEDADLMLLLGSSFEVEPARSLPALARARAVPLVVVNRTATPWDAVAALVIHADAAVTLAAATSPGGDRPRVRPMTAADFAHLCDVVDAWWGDHVRYLLHPMYVEQFGDTALVMDADDALAGFLVGYVSQRSPDEACVHMIGVAPDRRGQGVGRALYDRFIALARARGCRRVSAITVPQNAGAIAFHRALGFKPREDGAVWEGNDAVLLDYGGPGVHCVVMQREI